MTSEVSFSQVEGKFGTPNLLLGKTGATTQASIDSATFNPAQAGQIKETEAQVSWGFQSTQFSQRYPGFEANTSQSPIIDGLPIPRFVYKLTPRIGIGGIVIPFSLNQDIKAKGLTIVVLGQPHAVNLTGKGTLNGFANLFGGFAVNPALSIGLNFTYLSFKGSGDLSVVDAVGDPLASFSVAQTTIKLGVGFKIKPSPPLTIGLSTTAFSHTTQDTAFESGFSSIQNQDAATGENSASDAFSSFLNPIRGGIGLRINPSIRVYGELEYFRADRQYQEFSVVNLKKKPKDISNTLSAYLGSELEILQDKDILLGFFYEPSSVGPGSKESTGEAGFGFMDLALNLGEPPPRPQWMASSGVRFNLAKEQASIGKKIQRYQMAIETGIAYGETSIGIDNGEQPGAYLVKRIKVPFKLIYRF